MAVVEAAAEEVEVVAEGADGGKGGEAAVVEAAGACRSGTTAAAALIRMERGGGERSVSRDRDRREFGNRSDTSRVTRDHARPGWQAAARHRAPLSQLSVDRRRLWLWRSYAGYRGYCMSQFQAYDPVSGLYLGYDGLWYSCP